MRKHGHKINMTWQAVPRGRRLYTLSRFPQFNSLLLYYFGKQNSQDVPVGPGGTGGITNPDRKIEYPGITFNILMPPPLGIAAGTYLELIDYAETYIRSTDPKYIYILGQHQPTTPIGSGFDCGGWVCWLFWHFELLPQNLHPSPAFIAWYYDYFHARVDNADKLPGDVIIFYGENGIPNHAAIYIGNGYICDTSGGGPGYARLRDNYHTYRPLEPPVPAVPDPSGTIQR